eukprot:COSAG04_NODE_1292_length_7342_cov_14.979994_5_plen_353_part_00
MAAAVARLASGNQAKSTDGTEMLTAPETEQSDAAPAPFESESGAQKKGAAGAAAGAAAGFVKPSPVTGGPNMEAMLRQGFVRKVYGILAVQVAVTFGLIGVFQTQSINDMMKECHKITCVDRQDIHKKVECLVEGGLNPGATWAPPGDPGGQKGTDEPAEYSPHDCPGGMGFPARVGDSYYMSEPTSLMWTLHYTGLVVSFAALIMLVCCIQSLGRRYPHNYILLSTFTVAEGFMLATYCAFSDAQIILVAAGMTAAITIGLSVFACQTKIDFTGMGSYLFAALFTLIIFGWVIGMGYGPSENMRKLYLLAGVLIFSLYIVYDTQTIVGGEHKNFQFDMDDCAPLTLRSTAD